MSKKEKLLWLEAVLLLLLAMSAVAMLSEVWRQDWAAKEDRYPGVTRARAAERAEELLGEMTLEEKIGQLLVSRGGTPTPGGVVIAARGLTERDLRIIAESCGEGRFVCAVAEVGEVSVPTLQTLREALGREGVRMVTDWRRSPVQAMRDGGQLLVTGDSRRDGDRLLRAVKCGALPEETIDRAVLEILTVKIRWGITQ